jgi:hypothetical protein
MKLILLYSPVTRPNADTMWHRMNCDARMYVSWRSVSHVNRSVSHVNRSANRISLIIIIYEFDVFLTVHHSINLF